MSNSIVIDNIDTPVSVDAIKRAAAALQHQVLSHFYPAWGIDATIRTADTKHPPRRDEWALELRTTPTVDDALGYHDTTEAGLPRLFVFPTLDAENGVEWTVTASHEILEALADPWLRRSTQDDDGAFWALEACDACENQTYEINHVEVSDFLYPAWFEPPHDRTRARYDHLGQCTAPWQILEGGYAQRFDAKKGWVQLGLMRPGRQARRTLGISRGIRRAR